MHHASAPLRDDKPLSSPSLIRKILPFRPRPGSGIEPKPLIWDSKTFIMGILNLTPDSFSEISTQPHCPSLESSMEVLLEMVKNGLDLIDIGGQSTRPFATEVSVEEEISRIIPIIRAIRSHARPEIHSLIISVDTFQSLVAKEALEAGADMINDVTGGTRDPDMWSLLAEVQVPMVVMHSRGTPSTMTSPSETTYSEGVVSQVSKELWIRLKFGLSRGVRRWSLVLDPGIGFAKTCDGNLDILRGLKQFGEMGVGGGAEEVRAGGEGDMEGSFSNLEPIKGLSSSILELEKGSTSSKYRPHLESRIDFPSMRGFPILLGTSRKSFIGQITGVSIPKERVLGTAATCMAGILGGCHLLRVHDVKEMSQVGRMGDAIVQKGLK